MRALIIDLGRAAHTRLRPVLDVLLSVIVCLALGHAVASVVLWLVSLPLMLVDLEFSAAAWTFYRWSFGLVLTVGILWRRLRG